MMIETLSVVAGMKVFASTVGSMVIVVMVVLSLSDASAWLGDPGDARGHLCRALGKQLVQLLDGHARCFAEHPHSRPGSLLQVFLSHETDHLPVAIGERRDALLRGELGHHGLGPLLWIHEEPFVVAHDVGEFDGCYCHDLLLNVPPR